MATFSNKHIQSPNKITNMNTKQKRHKANSCTTRGQNHNNQQTSAQATKPTTNLNQ